MKRAQAERMKTVFRPMKQHILIAVAIAGTGYATQGIAAAQASPILSSNVEQTASTTSRGRSAPTSGSNGPTALPDDFTKLVIAPGFVLEFDVFGVGEMTHELNVDSEGNVIVPLIGSVHVAGNTLRQAELRMNTLLVEAQMIKSPQVSLRIVAFAKQSVTVAGEVQNPGRVQLLAPRSLLDVLALAGGETTAAGGQVEIRRPSADGLTVNKVELVSYASGKDSEAAQTALVYPGDEVYVQRAGVVYVLGAVERPGGYLMLNGGKLSVPQAIALALGTTSVASSKEAVIVRKSNGQISQLTVPLKKQQTGQAPSVALSDGDMLYIPTSKLKAALVNSQNVISSAASAGIVAGLQR